MKRVTWVLAVRSRGAGAALVGAAALLARAAGLPLLALFARRWLGCWRGPVGCLRGGGWALARRLRGAVGWVLARRLRGGGCVLRARRLARRWLGAGARRLRGGGWVLARRAARCQKPVFMRGNSPLTGRW